MKKNNETIALNILQVPHDEIKITHAYKWEYNHTRKNQVVLWMITAGEKWYYTALRSEPTEDGFIRPTKKSVEIIKKNNIKSWWRFLLFELFTFI